MKDSQLDKMTVKELMALEIDVKAAIESRKIAERADVKQKLQLLAEKSGFSAEELFGKERRGGAKGKSAALSSQASRAASRDAEPFRSANLATWLEPCCFSHPPISFRPKWDARP